MNDVNMLSDELAEILRKKKNHLLGMLNFTQLQTNAIEENDSSKLHEYINEKQKHIDEIDALDKSFVQKFEQLKSILGIKSLDEITGTNAEFLKPVRFELDGIYMLMDQILSIEKENSTKVKKKRDDIKNKIHEINSGKKMVSAYESKPISRGGAFFDKKK